MVLLPPNYLEMVFQFHGLALHPNPTPPPPPKKEREREREWAISKPIKIGLRLINLLEHRIKKICTNR